MEKVEGASDRGIKTDFAVPKQMQEKKWQIAKIRGRRAKVQPVCPPGTPRRQGRGPGVQLEIRKKSEQKPGKIDRKILKCANYTRNRKRLERNSYNKLTSQFLLEELQKSIDSEGPLW